MTTFDAVALDGSRIADEVDCRRVRLCLSSLLCFARALSLLTSSALAQEEPDEYREAIEAAVEELNAGLYEEALAQFSRAHELQPSARTLRGIGLAAYELRDYVRAVEALEASLEDPRR